MSIPIGDAAARRIRDALARFEEFLRGKALRLTPARAAIVEAAMARCGHYPIDDLIADLRARGIRGSRATVYRTLPLLAEAGILEPAVVAAEGRRYETTFGRCHHDHLICTRCGSIHEFHDPDLEALQQKVARSQGFHPLRHALHIYGLCQECLASRQPSLPLALAAPGERLRVERLAGGQGLACQLQDLGLQLGSELEVISSGGGNMVIAVKGCRVALGRGAAQKVLVSHVNNGCGTAAA